MLTRHVALACILLAGCSAQPDKAVESGKTGADLIIRGGPILTMAGDTPTYAEALVIEDGKIVFVGSEAEALKKVDDSTLVKDLGGKTLVPGFVDGHSHFTDSFAASQRANISAPPVGPARNATEIVATLKAFSAERGIKPGEPIIGYGYDENQMPKGQEPTRTIFDKAFPDNPVLIIHVSSHGAVMNSAAFAKYGYKDGMAVPAGGVIAMDANGRLTGLVMETGYLQAYANLPQVSEADEVAAARAGQQIYAAAGVTTAQEGATHANQLAQLQRLQKAGVLTIDVVAFPFMTDFDKIFATNPPSAFGTYSNHLKLGGCKIVSDGSPQGKTAAFTTPYLTGGPNSEKNWKGELNAPQAELTALLKTCYDKGLPVLYHANGDAAIDSLIVAHEAAAAGSLDKDRRTTVIHAQFIRPDQIKKFVQYKIIPSAFTDHTFFFGDTHVANRGKAQAAFLSPMQAYYAAGLLPANHTDYSVAPIDHMMTVWTAVNRVSRSGAVIGPDQRITPYQALKAITINGARIYREEDSKGTIETGKRADLVVLSADPTKVDPMTIKDIKVVETIKDGKTIWPAS